MSENDVNLAALWVPVMGETSQLKGQLVKAGTEGAAATAVAIRETLAAAAPFKGLGLQLSRELSAGVPEAQRSLGVLGGLLGNIHTGTALAVGGIAGFGAAVVTSAKAAGDFQQSLNKLVVSAGETHDGLQQVHDGILNLAGTVGYSVDQLADAMFDVEKAGHRGSEGITVLTAAAQGAQNEGAELKETLNGLTNSIHDFGFSADQSADVMSKLVVGAGMAKGSFQDFTGSLHTAESFVSNIGKSQNLTSAQLQHLMSDLVATGAQMTQTGMQAGNAFQDINHAAQKIISPTQQMRDMWGALGLDAQKLQDNFGANGVAGTMQILDQAIQAHTKDGHVNLDVRTQSAQLARAEEQAFNGLHPAARAVAEQIKNGTLSFKDFRKSRGGLSVELANEVAQWNSLNSKLTGFSSLVKSGIGDQISLDQALKLATGDQETLAVALATTGQNGAEANRNIATLDQTTRNADGSVKGANETQNNYNLKLKEFHSALSAARVELGEAFLPAMTHVADALKDGAQWLAQHKTVTEGLVIAVGSLSTAYLGLKGALAIKDLIDRLATAFTGVNKAAGEANKTMEASGASAKKGAAEVEEAATAEVAAEGKVKAAAVEADTALAGGAGAGAAAASSPGWLKGAAAAVPPALVGMQLGDSMREALEKDTPPDQKKAVDDWLKGGPPPNFSHADGGIQRFGKGGFLPDGATIAKPHGAAGLVQWAEPSTQGEAFIPLAPGKRRRSLEIWKQAGRLLGAFAGGGFEYPMDPGEVPMGDWAPAGTTSDGGSNGATTYVPNEEARLAKRFGQYFGKSLAGPHDFSWQDFFRDGGKDGSRWNTNIYQNDPGINKALTPWGGGQGDYNIPGGDVGAHRPDWKTAAANGGILSFDNGGMRAPSVPLIQRPDGTWTSPNPAWAHLIQRESSGNPTAQNNTDSNAMAGDPSQGLFQFTTATWQRMGGGQFAAHPGMATPQQQAMIAARLIQANPSGSDWGAGLPGRESASGLSAGLGTAGNPIYTTRTREAADRANSHVKEIQDRLSELKPDAKQSTKDHLNDELRYAKEDQARLNDKLAAGDTETGGTGSGGKTQSQAQQFGSGLLSGLMSDMGFGNVLGGKSPLEWPLVKMFTGLASVGLDAGNLWAAHQMEGQGVSGLSAGLGDSGLSGISAGLGGGDSSVDSALAGMGGGGGGGSKGWFGDLATSPLLNIPKMVSKGWFGDQSNVAPKPGAGLTAVPGGVPFQLVPSNVGSVPQAAGGGTSYSGGTTVHNNNSITVQGNTMTKPHELVGPMQEQMNSNTYSRSAFGGLPAAVGPGGG